MTKAQATSWIKLASWATFIMGLVAVGGSHPATAEAWRMLFDALDWPFDGTPPGFNRTERVMSAVIGGLLIGWATLIFGLLGQANPPYTTIWRSLQFWFFFDSAGSAFSGVYGNIILNAAFLFLFWVPLRRLRAQA